MHQRINDWLKAVPPLALSMIAFAAATPPKAVASNISEWMNFFGIQSVPAWLAQKSADDWIAYGCFVLAIIYSIIVWRAFLRRAAEKIIRPHSDTVLEAQSIQATPWLNVNSFTVAQASALWVDALPGTYFSMDKHNNPEIVAAEQLIRTEILAKRPNRNTAWMAGAVEPHVSRDELIALAKRVGSSPQFLVLGKGWN